MDELIYKKDLANEIQRIYDEHYINTNNQTVHDIFHAVLNRIYKAKTVNAESVEHGYWIDAYPAIEPNPMFAYNICSVCGFEQSISNKLPYCPYCGVNMKGTE